MPTHIQLHRSGVTGATPDVSTMLEGEPAVNFPDKKLFVKGADGSLITLVDAHTEHDAAGSVGGIQFKDSAGFSGDTNKFVFDSANVRVGIGTAAPREKLEVQGTILAAGVSADGATFGGNVRFLAGVTVDGLLKVENNLHLGGNIVHIGDDDTTIVFTDNQITLGAGTSGEPAIKVTNLKVELGDPEGAENATSFIVDDSNQLIDCQAATTSVHGVLESAGGLRHKGDTDTRIKFDTNNITIQAGSADIIDVTKEGVTFARSAYFPVGISAEGGTFGTKGITVDGGGKFAGGITAAYIDVTGNITGSASSIITMAAFFGPLVGNATTASSAGSATIATTATNVSVQGKSDDVDYRVVFAESAGSGTSALGAKVDTGAGDAGLLFNPSTDTLTTGHIHSSGVCGDGATFGAKGLTVDGDLYLSNQSRIRVQGDDESFYLNAGGGQLSLTYNAVDIAKQLRHSGDPDTLLEYTTNNILLQAGGTEFLESDISGVVHTPLGISGGGATFGINGITMGGNIHFADSTILGTATRTDSYTGQIETAADKTYTLDPKVAAARTVTAFYIKSASGTVTATLKNGSDTIKAASVSDSSGAQSSLANTSLAADAVLSIVTSSNSSALDVIFSVEYTTTL